MNASWTQGVFWSTAGQVIPVLGLALVLEARALARSWTLDRPLQRRVESALILVIGVALSFALSNTLIALARGNNQEQWIVLFTSVTIQSSFMILALNAVIVVATRGTLDAAVVIERALPWSRSNRFRRRVKKPDRNLPAIMAEIEQYIAKATTLRFSDFDRQFLEQTIGSASEPGLFPWSRPLIHD